MHRLSTLAGILLLMAGAPVAAQQSPPAEPPAAAAPTTPGPEVVEPPPPAQSQGFTGAELVAEGQRLFGNVSEGLASIVERATAQYGLPNGYIIGEEAAGAIAAGLRYGEGTLYTRNAGQHKVYWQGPSLGFDIGGNGVRTMMLVYNLPSVDAVFQRFVGVNGSAYVVAGFGMTVLSRNGITVVPIVSGVGARLGVNFGYLKFTPQPTWNPF